MKSKDLVNLMFSPLWISTLLHHFLSGVQQRNSQGIKTELLYLAIPFITDDIVISQLSTANARSTFASIFQKKKPLELKNSLIRKNSQVKQYREFTNRGLIYLGNIETLDIGKFITVAKEIKYQDEQGIKRVYCRAAYYLGVILAKEDYRDIFVKLGITNI